MNRGCCNAHTVAIIDALKKRQASERCPDVRRGLAIAIHTLATVGGCKDDTKEVSE